MTTTPDISSVVSTRRGGLRVFRTLRAKVLVSVNLIVALMLIGALILDYRHQLKTELSAYQTALSDEARVLLPGVHELQYHGVDTVQNYVDAVCATMQDGSSPGHHIVVDFGGQTIQARSHHRASDAILARIRQAAASPDGQLRTGGVALVVGAARNENVQAYIAEESEPVIARIRGQAIVRLFTLAGIGLIGSLLVSIIFVRLVTRPIGELVRVVRRIGAGELGITPQSFATEELDVLSVEIGRMSTDLEHRERDRAAHLKKAQRLQDHLQPHAAAEDDVSIAVMYRPADTIAGDYYDVLKLPDGSTLVCLADVCGHGVPAAMGAAILKTLLLSACEKYTSLPEILSHINARFLQVSLPEDFASMVLLRIDPTSHSLELASAGHEPSYLIRLSGEVIPFDSTGTLLGVSETASWETHRLEVSLTDRLVLLTDGVTEAANSQGQLFSRITLVQRLTSLGGQSVDDIAQTIIASLDLHCANAAVNDDQTILVLQLSATQNTSPHHSSDHSHITEGASP